MEHLLKSHLRTLIEAFMAFSGCSEATVCKRVFGSDRFLNRLEQSGSSFTVRTYDRAVAWFSANWPDGVDWPYQVPRPSPASSLGEQPAASSPAGAPSADVPPPASAEPLWKDAKK